MNKKFICIGVGLLFLMLFVSSNVLAVAPTLSDENPSDTSKLWNIDTTSITVGINCTSGTFDWNISTSPDIGSSGATTASNGTKSCTISGLAYSTEYTWYVNSTNGTLWTNASYTFTTRDAKLRENPALNVVEKAIVGVVGIVILFAFLLIVMKMDFKKEGALAKLLVGLIVALALLTVIFGAL